MRKFLDGFNQALLFHRAVPEWVDRQIPAVQFSARQLQTTDWNAGAIFLCYLITLN